MLRCSVFHLLSPPTHAVFGPKFKLEYLIPWNSWLLEKEGTTRLSGLTSKHLRTVSACPVLFNAKSGPAAHTPNSFYPPTQSQSTSVLPLFSLLLLGFFIHFPQTQKAGWQTLFFYQDGRDEEQRNSPVDHRWRMQCRFDLLNSSFLCSPAAKTGSCGRHLLSSRSEAGFPLQCLGWGAEDKYRTLVSWSYVALLLLSSAQVAFGAVFTESAGLCFQVALPLLLL